MCRTEGGTQQLYLRVAYFITEAGTLTHGIYMSQMSREWSDQMPHKWLKRRELLIVLQHMYAIFS